MNRRRAGSVEDVMSPMKIRSAMRASRRRLSVVLILLGLGGAVAVHHAMPPGMHGMASHHICLAVLAGVAVLAAAAVAVRAGRPRPRGVTDFRMPASSPPQCGWSTPAPQARCFCA